MKMQISRQKSNDALFTKKRSITQIIQQPALAIRGFAAATSFLHAKVSLLMTRIIRCIARNHIPSISVGNWIHNWLRL